MTMEELQAKLEIWKGAWPRLVGQALTGGINLLKQEIQRRYIGGPLHRSAARGRHLSDGLKSTVRLNPITAKVEVESKQQYKAQTHEHGATIAAKRGKYLIFDAGRGIRKVRSVTIPARPVFKPALESKRSEILKLISQTIYEAYDRGGL